MSEPDRPTGAGWTPVTMEWDKDVGIVGELNAALTAMNEAATFESLTTHYDGQRDNAKYLMPAGRQKWEAAYAANVLRLTQPQALRPAHVYVALVAKLGHDEATGHSDVRVYGSSEAAVRTTVHTLILTGNLYGNMTPDGVAALKSAVEANLWVAAADVLASQLRQHTVRFVRAAIRADDPRPDFTLVPHHGTEPRPWPSVQTANSAIEHRFARGGKGARGVYLVAEANELARMLTAYGTMSAETAAKTMERIGHIIENSAEDVSVDDRSALNAWTGRVEELAEEDDE